MQWKAESARGRRSDSRVSALDIVPTALAAAGAELPANLDGVDLLPFVQGKSRTPCTTTCTGAMAAAPRCGQGSGSCSVQPSKAVGAAAALYDLENDSAEAQDVAASHPEIVGKLAGSHASL